MTGTLRYEAEDYDQYGANRAKRRRWCCALTGVVVLVVIICAIAIPLSMKNNKNKNDESSASGGSKGTTVLEVACKQTRFYDLCMQSLQSYPEANSTDPRELVKIALYAANKGVSEELDRARKLQTSSDGNLSIVAADCVDNLVDSLDEINQTLDRLENWDSANVRQELGDLQTWMSSALTLQQTCHDNFVDLNVTGPAADLFLSNNTYVEELLKNALAKIQDAVDSAPEKSKKRYVIRIKAGTYKEMIVGKNSWNVMFIGDGEKKTIISGRKTVLGKGFIGRDFTVENTAGAINHQAVALHVGGDLAAFFRCTFKGFQDTLYTHNNRQFYKNCTITGTVDFIFGNAACVLQDCNIRPDVGLPGQQNTLTASGRTDPNQNTGISFHRCNIDATPSYKAATSPPITYLGRPWKQYALTVYLQSTLGSFIDPAGWLRWNGETGKDDTVYYAEYKNVGPGSRVNRRVSWSYQISNPSDARKFTPDSFLSASTWLSATNIQYSGTL
ncbi:hypothetical protein R1sor_027011 [Riccia sorocarpa]|uniref:Pectinesterase n=1 Tax=Riccia sorocarpa TaxID=122646 RepID=A0ABD3GDQ3_9MARC